MRKLGLLFIALALMAAMAVGVSASTGAKSAQSFATVSADGTCQISLALTVHNEQPGQKLYFPIPGDATGVSVNGSRVSAPKSGNVKRVNLSRIAGKVAGDVSVNIQYTLRDVIHTTEAGTLEMQVPLLSGFDYAVESLSFSVTLPGSFDALPGFTSGYHQAGIEEHLTYTVEGNTIIGSSLRSMKDHETLTMTMAVSEEMFPQSIVEKQSVATASVAMGIFAGVAVCYFLIFLAHLPAWPYKTSQPPQGLGPGQVGCVAALQGVDVTMHVFGWAQLGYVQIQRDHRGRVLLRKRMDMGNERSEAERRCFQKLFGKRNLVDTGAHHYAQLCRAMAKSPAGVGELLRKGWGNPAVFRGLAAGMGLCGGGGLGLALGSGGLLQGFWVFVLAAAGAVSGWFIQSWYLGIRLRFRRKMAAALGLCVLWLLLGIIAGQFAFTLWMVIGLLFAGMLYSWSGQRTELGRQTLAQLTGLKRYLKKPGREELRQRCQEDSDYFFQMLPLAMALGVDLEFAKAFGAGKLPECPYVTTGREGQRNARQWCRLLRDTAEAMDRRANRLPLEKLMGAIQSLTRG